VDSVLRNASNLPARPKEQENEVWSKTNAPIKGKSPGKKRKFNHGKSPKKIKGWGKPPKTRNQSFELTNGLNSYVGRRKGHPSHKKNPTKHTENKRK